jgi:hypothetical protein
LATALDVDDVQRGAFERRVFAAYVAIDIAIWVD